MNTPSHPEWSAERMALLCRIHELEEENARLRELLGIDIREERPKEQPLQLSLQEKVELFRSLFKGREDVFARRWVSKANGKAGYQPFAQGNGIHNFVIKRSSNVVNVPIESWPH